MIKPLDLFVRVTALPHLAWSASGAILEARRRIAEVMSGDPESSPFAAHMFDGLFDRIEEQCRSRWFDVFGRTDDEREEADPRAA
jgi:hypothetical protein